LKAYGFFWGCQIPARLAFMEKSTRMVTSTLGVDIRDIEGLTCCPYDFMVKNKDPQTWMLTAARNLALAEAQEVDLVEVCNGCYRTLKNVATTLKTNPILRKKINEQLAAVDLAYEARYDVKHFIQLMHDDVGTTTIKKRVVRPLAGVKIAVHYGCHMSRPHTAGTFDDPLFPTKFDALITALGAKSVPYETKNLCCGEALATSGNTEEAEGMARTKLIELSKKKVDAMAVVCPACFLQYDAKQAILARRGEQFNIPVLTLAELMGFAFGFEPVEMGVEMHKVSTDSFFEAWAQKSDSLGLVVQSFDYAALERCYNCGACVHDCPVSRFTLDFNPNTIIGQVLRGEIEAVLEEGKFWQCMECHLCFELCPQRFEMEKVFHALKNLAIDRGLQPKPVASGIELFFKTGRLGEPLESHRKKLSLPEFPSSGKEDLEKLLKSVKGKKGK